MQRSVRLHRHGALSVMMVVALAASMPTTGGERNPALTDPTLATDTAPDVYRVKLETTSGDVVIEVYRKWAPMGADRFFNLVKIGYYDDTAFYRVIDGFMAQVGMHGDPQVQAAWANASIKDDPILKPNSRGMVTFAARTAPDSRTTQFFINYGDNSRLRVHGKFAPFGKVVEGMEVVDSLYSGYGEGAPRGRGPSQGTIMREGNEYLKKDFPRLDYINRATIVQ
jgi:peptidyl-prolyl cis-trans isomerase A (cyclophilin A)